MRRNFRENPITEQELLECTWYAVTNDLIGGWDISNVNKPESQRNPYRGEFEMGTFMTQATAQHIADIHNLWWDQQVWNSYSNNLRISAWYDGLTEDDWFDYASPHETT